MANNGINWIDQTFNFCVYLLYDLAHILGITYDMKLMCGYFA